ncbi:MAG TPA: hypothetical protein C5S50_06320 [Methanosarcinaceae archaeon]|nr:hypothetical protein [Methanosarcinaceae archaeon]
MPYNRSCELLSDVDGCEISPATLIRAENECFEGLEEFENVLNEGLKQSPVIGCDESGMRINGIRKCSISMMYSMIFLVRRVELIYPKSVLVRSLTKLWANSVQVFVKRVSRLKGFLNVECLKVLQ